MNSAVALTPPTWTGLAQGPIEDPRHGKSLIINPFGDQTKICSFNCAYCDLGLTETRLNRLKANDSIPTAIEILEHAREFLKTAHLQGPRLDAIVVSGNGEPTLHPEFPALIAGLIELRSAWLKDRPIVVYSNGTTLDQRKTVEALNLVDERIIKVDAGNEKVFKELNAPLARVNLARILSGIKSLKDVTIQSLFCKGTVDNTQSSDIDDWIEAVIMLRPKRVHIQGASRPTAVAGILRCDEDTLHMIASRFERRSGIKAIVTP